MKCLNRERDLQFISSLELLMAGVQANMFIHAIAGPSSAIRCQACLISVAGPRAARAALGRQPALPRPFSHAAILASGHNRWSKIRHKKGAADAQKSTVYSKITLEIYSALRPPNSMDPLHNSKLAAALTKAKEAGIPKYTVEACFAKAKSQADGTGQTVVYEALGPGGTEAMIIECVTENPAKTVARIKEVLHKQHCRIAPVSYLFEKKGLVTVSPVSASNGFDEIFDLALDAGADDVQEAEGDSGPVYEITTAPTSLSQLTNALNDVSSFKVESSEIAYIPSSPLEVLEADQEGEGISLERAEAIEKVVDNLEGEADVIRVWTNLA